MPDEFVRVMKTQSMTKQELTRSDNRKMVAIVMAKDAMQIFRQSSPRMISSISHMEYIGENGKDLPWNPDDLIKCLTVFMASMPQVQGLLYFFGSFTNLWLPYPNSFKIRGRLNAHQNQSPFSYFCLGTERREEKQNLKFNANLALHFE